MGNNMSYTITPSAQADYIIVKVVGNISQLLALAYNLEAHALGKQLGINRFLLEFSECRNTDTVLRNYKYVDASLRNPDINHEACTVMLVSPGDHSHDFIEALFRSNGSDVTIFNDHELAISYLLRF